MQLTMVTSNLDKAHALRSVFQPLGYSVNHVDLPLIEPQATSVEAVAISKAEQAHRVIKQPLVVEDSGFFIEELRGFPGPYTKYVLETIGITGILKTANQLTSRACRFVSVLVYIDKQGLKQVFTDYGDGDLSTEIDTTECNESWSELWRIFIPQGSTMALTAMSREDRLQLLRKWQIDSVYTQIAKWLPLNTLNDNLRG